MGRPVESVPFRFYDLRRAFSQELGGLWFNDEAFVVSRRS
jgi:hypothetical protein